MDDTLTTQTAATNDEFGFDIAAFSTPIPAIGSVGTAAGTAAATDPTVADRHAGRVRLDNALLRHLRQLRLQSQQDLADDCWRRNIRVSIATIKRAESGHAVRYRIAHELARCFDVPVMQIVSVAGFENR